MAFPRRRITVASSGNARKLAGLHCATGMLRHPNHPHHWPHRLRARRRRRPSTPRPAATRYSGRSRRAEPRPRDPPETSARQMGFRSVRGCHAGPASRYGARKLRSWAVGLAARPRHKQPLSSVLHRQRPAPWEGTRRSLAATEDNAACAHAYRACHGPCSAAPRPPRPAGQVPRQSLPHPARQPLSPLLLEEIRRARWGGEPGMVRLRCGRRYGLAPARHRRQLATACLIGYSSLL